MLFLGIGGAFTGQFEGDTMFANFEIDANPKYGEIEEMIDGVEKRFNRFKNFDILNAYPPSDHHYYNDYKSKGSNRGINMAQEHKLLQEKLPESIFVRAYESQVNLLRAAIIGPPNTPYAYGLFFFDILIPKGYPSFPPKLHYTSYENSNSNSLTHPPLPIFGGKDGKVNLKILESPSWYDRIINRLLFGSEEDQKKRWNPNTTILDVLLTIQESLSNHSDEESFLEHWWRSKSNKGEGDKTVWLSTCEGMMQTLEKPPRDFEDLVRGHFRKRAHTILMLFRDIKDDVFYKLLKAFQANGTYCKHHLGQVGQIKKKEKGSKWLVA